MIATTPHECAPSDPLNPAPVISETAISANENHSAAKDQKRASEEAPNDRLLVKYTKSLRNWTMGLVIVGVLTVAILSLQWLTFEKTDETNRVALRPYISGVGLNAEVERWPGYWVLKAVLENTGGTPSLDLRYVIRSSPEFPVDPEEMYQWPSETDAFFDRHPAEGANSGGAGSPFNTFYADPQKFWYVSGASTIEINFVGVSSTSPNFAFGSQL